jgi:hypothetical protein
MNKREKGEFAQLKTELRAAEKGWIVSRTVEGARYDLILDDHSRLYRTQVKYVESPPTHSVGSVNVHLRKRGRRYTSEEIDVLIVYIPQIDRLCWFDAKMFENRASFVVRYAPPKKSGRKLNLAEDYLW